MLRARKTFLLPVLILLGFGVLEADATTISRAEVDREEAPSVLLGPEDVTEEKDLQTYAISLMRDDERIEGIDFLGYSVEVRYKEEGRLLALVPISFTARAIAYADGGVELVYPWFSRITRDNEGEIETELQVAVDTALARSTVGWVKAEGEPREKKFSPSESVRVAHAMQEVLLP